MVAVLPILLTSVADTMALGRRLATLARKGDVISLSGPLGIGKTVFVRGFVRERLGEDIEVTSPTFTLVHTYDDTEPTLWHFDLFRLEQPEEIEELGIDEAMASGISLIEWPDKGGAWLPSDRLDLAFRPSNKDNAREVIITRGPSWIERLQLSANHAC